MSLSILGHHILKYLSNNSVKATVATGLANQICRPLVALLTIPLLIRQLGEEGIGVWMLALSIMGLIGSMSAGLSASLTTAIGRAGAEASPIELGEMVTAALVIASVLSCSIALLVIPTILFVDWAWLLSLQNDISGEDVRSLFLALALILLSSIMCSIPRQVMFGRMHGYLAHMLELLGLASGTFAIFWAASHDAPLWLLGVAFTAPGVASLGLGGLAYFRMKGITVRQLSKTDPKMVRALGFDSARMTAYQASVAISSQSDLLLIGTILGAHAVGPYAVAQRIFSLPVMISMTINTAQWPALARADAGHDHLQFRRILAKSLLLLGLTTGSLVALLGLTYEKITEIWLGQLFHSDPLILYGMVIWAVVATLVNTLDVSLRALGYTSFLMKCMLAMTVINITTTLILLPVIGASGAVWGNVVGFTCALLIPFSLKLSSLLRGQSR